MVRRNLISLIGFSLFCLIAGLLLPFLLIDPLPAQSVPLQPLPPQSFPPQSAPAESTAAQSAPPAPARQQVVGDMDAESLGDLHMLHRQYVSAIRAYGKAPASPKVWNKLGIAWNRLFAFARARHYFQQAIVARPDFADALNNLGVSWFEEENYGRATRCFRQALQLAPGSPVVLFNLGSAYFANGKRREGADAWQKAFALNPKIFAENEPPALRGFLAHPREASMYYCLAQIHARAGLRSQTLDYLRKAADHGFSDDKRLARDPAFADLSSTPEFDRLLSTIKEGP